MTTEEQLSFIRSYDFEILARPIFETTPMPKGLHERAAQYPGAWVIYDPCDSEKGFLLVGDDDAKLISDTYTYIQEAL